ncbi:hypothetical protein BGP_2899 [Beggiatoa sp. PS]|nr:hypothetical protein BGP_2899 [Beggiatoa sp. PS]
MNELKEILGEALELVMETIEQHIEGFFVKPCNLIAKLCVLSSYKSRVWLVILA